MNTNTFPCIELYSSDLLKLKLYKVFFANCKLRYSDLQIILEKSLLVSIISVSYIAPSIILNLQLKE